jgi:hypothetical protein
METQALPISHAVVDQEVPQQNMTSRKLMLSSKRTEE